MNDHTMTDAEFVALVRKNIKRITNAYSGHKRKYRSRNDRKQFIGPIQRKKVAVVDEIEELAWSQK